MSINIHVCVCVNLMEWLVNVYVVAMKLYMVIVCIDQSHMTQIFSMDG